MVRIGLHGIEARLVEGAQRHDVHAETQSEQATEVGAKARHRSGQGCEPFGQVFTQFDDHEGIETLVADFGVAQYDPRRDRRNF